MEGERSKNAACKVCTCFLLMSQSHQADFNGTGTARRACWLILCLLSFSIHLRGKESHDLRDLSLHEVEENLAAIDSELEELARPTLRSGVGNLGWASRAHVGGDETEWIEIDLGEDKLVDQIVLVPVIWRDAQFGARANAFPRAFEVIVGRLDDRVGEVVASFGPNDPIYPRIAPLIIPVEPITASWVRIRATSLSPNIENSFYSLQLSEVMVFEGEENWALNRPVKVSSSARTRVQHAISAKALVDGFTPYVVDTAQGEASKACVIFYRKSLAISLTADLGESVPLDRIHLHAADVSESVPKIQYADYAFPKHFPVRRCQSARLFRRGRADRPHKAIYLQRGPHRHDPVPGDELSIRAPLDFGWLQKP